MINNPFKHVAYQYVELGLSVIPVNDKKHPIVPWKKYQTVRPTTQDINMMFDFARGIAIVTGAVSNLVVVDDDRGKNGLTPLVLDSPIISKTKNGGRHFYFRYENTLKTKISRDTRVDIKSDGGYVVIPPSRGYEWIKPINRESIDTLSCIPENLFSQLLEVNPLKPQKTRKIRDKSKSNEYHKFVLPRHIREGERNEILYKFACKMLFRMHDIERVKELVIMLNNTRCYNSLNFQEGIPMTDITKLMNSATKYYLSVTKTGQNRTTVQ